MNNETKHLYKVSKVINKNIIKLEKLLKNKKDILKDNIDKLTDDFLKENMFLPMDKLYKYTSEFSEDEEVKINGITLVYKEYDNYKIMPLYDWEEIGIYGKHISAFDSIHGWIMYDKLLKTHVYKPYPVSVNHINFVGFYNVIVKNELDNETDMLYLMGKHLEQDK